MTISEYALKFVGRPYIWGGDGSGKCGGGFDCSGLVLECLWAFGILPNGDRIAGLQSIVNRISAPFVPNYAVARCGILRIPAHAILKNIYLHTE